MRKGTIKSTVILTVLTCNLVYFVLIVANYLITTENNIVTEHAIIVVSITLNHVLVAAIMNLKRTYSTVATCVHNKVQCHFPKSLNDSKMIAHA